MNFIVITIDTEIDKSPNWNVSGDQTFYSVLNGIPNKLVPLFNNFGSKPTYLLSSEVIENKDCVSVLKDIRNCELGTHLHGDLVDPQKRIKNMANQNTSEIQSSYSQEIEFEKLKNLTDLFINKFGHRPTSFRAGRFGAGNNTISALENLGYLVDSSVTPGVNWDLLEGKINYLDAKCQPYFPSRLEILREGESTVLEVPISIVSPSVRRLFYVREKIMGGIPLTKKIIDYMFPIIWLRPSWNSSGDMLYVLQTYMNRYKSCNHIVVNMMFHSMEIIPNASPYTKTEKECMAFLERINVVLKYCSSNNIQFVTLSELYPFFPRNGEK